MNREQYIKGILKKLKCSSPKKKEIGKELEADITAALNAGETMEEVMKRMGDAAFVASEFNRNFSKEELAKAKRKKVLIAAISIFIILFVILGAGFFAIPKSYPLDKSGIYTEEELIERAETVIGYFNEEDYESIHACATEQMRQVMTKESMDTAKAYISDDWGAFLSYGNVYSAELVQMGNSMAVIQITATYENTAVTYTLSFDKDLNLAGFYIK